VNTTFGSKVIVPGTGVVLNNEMDDFSIYPGVPNAFGLVGAENNSVAPGKRPLSSMSPTIVLDAAGKPVLTVGAAGGPKIISQVVLAILRQIDVKQSLVEAVDRPRIHHQWRPNVVTYEQGLDRVVVNGLRERGHELEEVSGAGRTQAIALTNDGNLVGTSDQRGYGKAVGK
jgi:gamma-glutamyltranspeptidase/glutathione hydrolase